MDVEKLVRMPRLKLYKERATKKAAFHLRGRAAIDQRNQKVLERGMRVGILWGGENKIFKGTLGHFNKRCGMWKVHYDDGSDIFELAEHIAQKGESFQV